ncbi:MAG: hypothetical protein ACXVEW_01390 [Solirubrobacteraceae bacterium]
MRNANALRWQGQPGHYEVYYLTATEPRSGVGIWIRYTMLAPLQSTGDPATCALWLAAMDPNDHTTIARKLSFAIDRMRASSDPFELRIDDAVLSDERMTGGFEDVAWDLSWTRAQRAYEHVHPALARLGVAKTVLVLPHADLSIDGSVTIADERLELSATPGAQAHLWGSQHARSWVWVHCNDLHTVDGEPVPDSFVDGVSVMVPRMGREIGPSTPIVGRLHGSDFISTSPARVLANHSTFALTGWRFEAFDGKRKLVGEVDSYRDQIVGVTYHDPDGEPAYCYDSETATLRLHVHERARQVGGWRLRETFVAHGRSHFEYGQRSPVPDIGLLVT